MCCAIFMSNFISYYCSFRLAMGWTLKKQFSEVAQYMSKLPPQVAQPNQHSIQ
jgi:hypothetical protein